jgi:hypothetical protein
VEDLFYRVSSWEGSKASILFVPPLGNKIIPFILDYSLRQILQTMSVNMKLW